MKMEFDVEDSGFGIELVPDFYLADLPREIREEYREMVDSMSFKNGALQITGPDTRCFDPPERITIEEMSNRIEDEFDVKVFDKEDGYMPDS